MGVETPWASSHLSAVPEDADGLEDLPLAQEGGVVEPDDRLLDDVLGGALKDRAQHWARRHRELSTQSVVPCYGRPNKLVHGPPGTWQGVPCSIAKRAAELNTVKVQQQ